MISQIHFGSIMNEQDPTESLPAPEGGRHQLRRGDRLGDRFTIVQFLARGGMGEVYEAVDEHLQAKHIALKTLRAEIADDVEMRARFAREVLLAREVNHRNVCPTYDLFRLEGPRGPVLCLTMKLLRRESLAARLRRLGPMPPEAVLPNPAGRDCRRCRNACALRARSSARARSESPERLSHLRAVPSGRAARSRTLPDDEAAPRRIAGRAPAPAGSHAARGRPADCTSTGSGPGCGARGGRDPPRLQAR